MELQVEMVLLEQVVSQIQVEHQDLKVHQVFLELLVRLD
jgi:hypothetical protein